MTEFIFEYKERVNYNKSKYNKMLLIQSNINRLYKCSFNKKDNICYCVILYLNLKKNIINF